MIKFNTVSFALLLCTLFATGQDTIIKSPPGDLTIKMAEKNKFLVNGDTLIAIVANDYFYYATHPRWN